MASKPDDLKQDMSDAYQRVLKIRDYMHSAYWLATELNMHDIAHKVYDSNVALDAIIEKYTEQTK